MSIDATHVVYSIERANLSGSRWEVGLDGVLVDAPSAPAALGVIAQAVCRPDTPPPGDLALLVKNIEEMTAARMSPEWVAGALWSVAWLRGEVS